jgi:hypothetical protein
VERTCRGAAAYPEPVSSVEALRAAAAVGPYFVWEPWSDGTGWRPVTDLTDRDVVAERVGAARTALSTMFGLPEDAVPARVIASVTFLGVASRLLSPPFAAMVLGGVLPAPRLGDLWWRPVPGGPWPIAYSGDGTAGDFPATIVDGLVTPILQAFRDRFVLSPRVLWGNVASALAGAAGMLADQRPDHADAAGRLAERVLARPPLAGTGALVRPDPARPRRFLVRRNCCLYYRIPGGGTCADCILTPEADRLAAWQSALDT